MTIPMSSPVGDGTQRRCCMTTKRFSLTGTENLLVLPVTIYGEVYTAAWLDASVWQGAYVFDVSLERGLDLRGKITHCDGDEPEKTLYGGTMVTLPALSRDRCTSATSSTRYPQQDRDERSGDTEGDRGDQPELREMYWPQCQHARRVRCAAGALSERLRCPARMPRTPGRTCP